MDIDIQGESDRLRKVAKEHANGGLDLEDYRNIRGAVIESIAAASDANSSGEDEDVTAFVPDLAARAEAGLGNGTGGSVDFADESPLTLLSIIGVGIVLILAVVGLYLMI